MPLTRLFGNYKKDDDDESLGSDFTITKTEVADDDDDGKGNDGAMLPA